MKPRRGISFIVFAACAGAVGVSLVLLTTLSLRLEHREAQARVETKFQESIRLAIWKMEAVVSPVIRQEVGRPYFQYMAFYPTDRAYTRMFEEVHPGDVLVPSPLLTSTPAFIHLHFQIDEASRLSSPQAPEGNQLDLAEAEYVSGHQVETSRAMLDQLGRVLLRGPVEMDAQHELAAGREFRDQAPFDSSPAAPAEGAELDANVQGALDEIGGADRLREARTEEAPGSQTASAPESEPQARKGDLPPQGVPEPEQTKPQQLLKDILTNQAPPVQQVEDADDYRERSKRVQETYAQTSTGAVMPAPDAGRPSSTLELRASGAEIDKNAADANLFDQQLFTPVWRTGPARSGPQLFFIREVRVGESSRFQGFWVDWLGLRSAMLEAGHELLPDATLEPVYEGNDALVRNSSGRMIASLPALLIPGPAPLAVVPAITPTRFALVFTWLLAIAAMGTIGYVLRASTDLAERRGQFVTAVTHELRTPLTTFCLYTDLLADNLVKEEQTRHDYLTTLRGESRRLAGIVEGVLEYARLGRRSRPMAAELAEIEGLLTASLPPLIDRAGACGKSIVFTANGLDGLRSQIDQSTLDRILLNLVENACKYAGEADDRRIEISAATANGSVEVRVRDYGPGVAPGDRARIFEPFQRARRDAEGPNPGLGLGLALSRGLARELGGDLRYQPAQGPGAQFVLSLPVRAARG